MPVFEQKGNITANNHKGGLLNYAQNILLLDRISVTNLLELLYEFINRYRYSVTQQYFELKLTMPPTDRGGRGYSDEHVAQAIKELIC